MRKSVMKAFNFLLPQSCHGAYYAELIDTCQPPKGYPLGIQSRNGHTTRFHLDAR